MATTGITRGATVNAAAAEFGHRSPATIQAFTQFLNTADIQNLIRLKQEGKFDYGVTIKTSGDAGPRWPAVGVVKRVMDKLDSGQELAALDFTELGVSEAEIPKLLMTPTSTRARKAKTAEVSHLGLVTKPDPAEPSAPVADVAPVVSAEPSTPVFVGVPVSEDMKLLGETVKLLQAEVVELRKQLGEAMHAAARQRMVLAGQMDLVLATLQAVDYRSEERLKELGAYFDVGYTASPTTRLPAMSPELTADLNTVFRGLESDAVVFVADAPQTVVGPTTVAAVPDTSAATEPTFSTAELQAYRAAADDKETPKATLADICKQLGLTPSAMATIMRNAIRLRVSELSGG